MEKPRIILLNGEVNAYTATDVILQLLDLNKMDDKEEISLYINSPGGDVDFGLAIYDTIQHISAPVSTVCYGMAASMGGFLLTCGVKGRRFALPHSRILIHQPLTHNRSTSYNTQTALVKMSESFIASRRELERIMADNIGVPIEKIHADCERDYWMSAEEALAYGIIDGILDRDSHK